MKIAIVGGGISGNLAARLLATRHLVTLFESEPYAGGHTNTVEIEVGGRPLAVDTGFMVFNDRTYPLFCELLGRLGVDSQPGDMSFSVACERSGFEFQGSSLNGLFSRRRHLASPRFYRFLAEILRLNRTARRWLREASDPAGLTLAEFLAAHHFSGDVVERYLLPMGAAIWSARVDRLREFPARFLLGFFEHHGLLQLRDRPQWRTVVGGARNYVRALLAPLGDRVRLGCPVRQVRRFDDRVEVTPVDRPSESYDAVVLAVHADQALRMLADADRSERAVLTALPYQPNEAVLHTDTAWLPRQSRAWASWNYRLVDDDTAAACVTYDLTRLQRLATPQPVLVTLNPPRPIAPAHVLARFHYQHPEFGLAALAAQARWGEISGQRRTHFCGAYWGFGFHEDGVRSAVRVANSFGIGLEACTVACIEDESAIAAAAP